MAERNRDKIYYTAYKLQYHLHLTFRFSLLLNFVIHSHPSFLFFYFIHSHLTLLLSQSCSPMGMWEYWLSFFKTEILVRTTVDWGQITLKESILFMTIWRLLGLKAGLIIWKDWLHIFWRFVVGNIAWLLQSWASVKTLMTNAVFVFLQSWTLLSNIFFLHPYLFLQPTFAT